MKTHPPLWRKVISCLVKSVYAIFKKLISFKLTDLTLNYQNQLPFANLNFVSSLYYFYSELVRFSLLLCKPFLPNPLRTVGGPNILIVTMKMKNLRNFKEVFLFVFHKCQINCVFKSKEHILVSTVV